jgi:hypothetical protein
LPGRSLDIQVFVLPRAALRREHGAPIHLLEVAVREAVVRLRVLVRLVIDSEVPARVLVIARN